MAFRVYEVVRVACPRIVSSFTSRFSRGVNKPATRQKRDANDFVNPKSHETEKPLLLG